MSSVVNNRIHYRIPYYNIIITIVVHAELCRRRRRCERPIADVHRLWWVSPSAGGSVDHDSTTINPTVGRLKIDFYHNLKRLPNVRKTTTARPSTIIIVLSGTMCYANAGQQLVRAWDDAIPIGEVRNKNKK